MLNHLVAVGHAAVPSPPPTFVPARPARTALPDSDDDRARAEAGWADVENNRWLSVKEAVRRWQELERTRATDAADDGRRGREGDRDDPRASQPSEAIIPPPTWLSLDDDGTAATPIARGREETRIGASPVGGNRRTDHQADAELVARLAAQGFTGPDHERLVDQLARYGLAVIGPWVKPGYILQRCATRRIRGLPTPIPVSWAPDVLEDLVQDTVALAVIDFERNALRGGRWRPDGGAALSTYFIGTCLFAFAQVYRRRHDGWRRELSAQAAMRLFVGGDGVVPDIADAVVEHDTVTSLLAATTPDPKLRLIVFLHYAGYRAAEIAAVLDDGTSGRAVEGMLYRYRRQLRRGSAEEVDQDER